MRFVNRRTSVALLRCPLGPKEKKKKDKRNPTRWWSGRVGRCSGWLAVWLLLPAASAVATTQRPPDLNFEYTNTTDPLGESVPSHVVEAPSGVSSGRQPWQSFAPGGFRQHNAEQQSRRLVVRGWQDGPWNDVDPWVTVTWWVGLAIAGFSFCNCGSDLLVVCSGVAAFWIPNTNPWNSTYPREHFFGFCGGMFWLGYKLVMGSLGPQK